MEQKRKCRYSSGVNQKLGRRGTWQDTSDDLDLASDDDEGGEKNLKDDRILAPRPKKQNRKYQNLQAVCYRDSVIEQRKCGSKLLTSHSDTRSIILNSPFTILMCDTRDRSVPLFDKIG